MSTASQEAKDIIRRWNEEGWSGGNYDLAYEIISPNMVVHGAGGQTVGMGPDGLIDLIRTWRTAFPDGRMEIDDIIVEGDLVAIRNTWYGTQQAEFYGVPPSGTSVAVTSVGIDRVEQGKVSEGWGELDMVGMMQQMGALPTVGPGAVASGAEPVWGPTASSAAGSETAATRELLVALIAALASGDEAGARELVDTDAFVDHSPGWGTRSFDSVLASYAALRAAFPDLSFEVDEEHAVAEATQAAAHSIVRGTHTGAPLFGVEPSGNAVVWTHTDFVRADCGKIVERWTASDTLSLYQQLGLLPAPGG